MSVPRNEAKSTDEPTASQLPIEDEVLSRIDSFRNRHHTAMLVVMFTDLKGSTELAEQQGEVRAQELREEHDRMLRQIVERDGDGECLKTIGDSLMCVFAEPTTAVKRAVEIQQLLTKYNAGHKSATPMHVRIGIHVGQVVIEGRVQKDVFGRHVNRAARVEALADAGQVLMTHAVYDSAAGWLAEEGLLWCDHGEYRLKGISEPVRIMEVCSTGEATPRAPQGQRVRRHSRLPWVIAIGALIAAAVLFAVSLSSPQPLQVKLGVQVARDGRLGHTVVATLPHVADDRFSFSGMLSRPAFVVVCWVDAKGDVKMVIDHSAEEKAAVRFPTKLDEVVPIEGSPGSEIVLVVAGEESFNADRLRREIAGLGPPPSVPQGSPPYVVWFDDQSVRREPEYRAAGKPERVGQLTPQSYAETVRHLCRKQSLHVSGIVLPHD